MIVYSQDFAIIVSFSASRPVNGLNVEFDIHLFILKIVVSINLLKFSNKTLKANISLKIVL